MRDHHLGHPKTPRSRRTIVDDQQLAAIGAGGVLRDITQAHGALRLTELRRFTDPAEATASLALRDRDASGLDFYLHHRRVHVGDMATMTEDAFNAWVSDRAAGHDTIILAPTRELSPASTAARERIVLITLKSHPRCAWPTAGPDGQDPGARLATPAADFSPLHHDIASTALFYLDRPHTQRPEFPHVARCTLVADGRPRPRTSSMLRARAHPRAHFVRHAGRCGRATYRGQVGQGD
jgi:hypothetical protein